MQRARLLKDIESKDRDGRVLRYAKGTEGQLTIINETLPAIWMPDGEGYFVKLGEDAEIIAS